MILNCVIIFLYKIWMQLRDWLNDFKISLIDRWWFKWLVCWFKKNDWQIKLWTIFPCLMSWLPSKIDSQVERLTVVALNTCVTLKLKFYRLNWNHIIKIGKIKLHELTFSAFTAISILFRTYFYATAWAISIFVRHFVLYVLAMYSHGTLLSVQASLPPWSFLSAVKFCLLPWSFVYCRGVLFIAVKFCLLPWSFVNCRDTCGPPYDCMWA